MKRKIRKKTRTIVYLFEIYNIGTYILVEYYLCYYRESINGKQKHSKVIINGIAIFVIRNDFRNKLYGICLLSNS